jgi:hypothetical protein
MYEKPYDKLRGIVCDKPLSEISRLHSLECQSEQVHNQTIAWFLELLP